MSETSSSNPPSQSGWHTVGVKQLVWIAGILAVTIVLTVLTADVTKASEPGVRLVNGELQLPDRVGDWSGGKPEGMTETEKHVLPEDTLGIRRHYVDGQGRELNCTVILAGRDVTSIHRPELCLPGQGWTIQREHVESIRLRPEDGNALQVMRMDAVHTVAMAGPGRPAQAIFAYWFIGKDRTTPHHWQRILWTTADRVLHNRNHRWAYLLLMSPVRVGATTEATEHAQTETMKTLGEFVEQLYPMMRPISKTDRQ
jgi:EpsI family protein